MKFLVLICFVILFDGCSAKCIQNDNCNGFERGIKKTLDVAASIAKVYNDSHISLDR